MFTNNVQWCIVNDLTSEIIQFVFMKLNTWRLVVKDWNAVIFSYLLVYRKWLVSIENWNRSNKRQIQCSIYQRHHQLLERKIFAMNNRSMTSSNRIFTIISDNGRIISTGEKCTCFEQSTKCCNPSSMFITILNHIS